MSTLTIIFMIPRQYIIVLHLEVEESAHTLLFYLVTEFLEIYPNTLFLSTKAELAMYNIIKHLPIGKGTYEGVVYPESYTTVDGGFKRDGGKSCAVYWGMVSSYADWPTRDIEASVYSRYPREG